MGLLRLEAGGSVKVSIFESRCAKKRANSWCSLHGLSKISSVIQSFSA
ncbi:MAG: hypothetical protein WBJ21_13950 [Burkholderiaceae bacterium]